MPHSFPLVALVGQPNVGKSTLLNKIAGHSHAVTSPVAGTTRDRQYIDTVWNGVAFTLVDTAGLMDGANDELELGIHRQIDIALSEADVVILLVDGKQPLANLDQKTLLRFRKIKKPLLLAVNKLDSPKTAEETLGVFQRLGIKPMFGISSISGKGIGDLLDAVVAQLKPQTEDIATATAPAEAIAVSIVGKPNVGKSSIFNAIMGEERVVVSPIPGTTRTAIDSTISIGNQTYTFIDTAGLKKKEHRQAEPDIFSGFQTFKSIRRSDVCLFVIDASQEITKQDQRVAQEIFAMEKGCVILANKCDLVADKKAAGTLGKNARSLAQNRDDKYQTVRDYISHNFPFLWMCPLFFVSAATKENLDEALAAIEPISERRNKTTDQETLDEFLNKLLKKNPPKLLRDQKKPKVFSLRQTGTVPPAFELLVNHPAAISQQFRKFVENSIIRDLNFWGTPIVLRLKGKDKS